jgi:4-amino-4-deoxy-L-arabinose transferase-like glycosyltransferase
MTHSSLRIVTKVKFIQYVFERRQVISGIILIGLVILSLMYRWRVVYYHLINLDDGHFTTVGWLMYCCHYIPYRDIFDHKPPIIYFAISGVMHILGPSNSSIRWAFTFLTLLSSISLYYTGRILFDNRYIALLAAILYTFDYDIITWGSVPRTETLAAAFGLMGISLFVKATKNHHIRHFFLILSGIFFGLSFLSKQNGLFYLAVIAFWLLMCDKDKQVYKRIIQFILLIFGFIMVLLLVLMYMLLNGALSDFITQVVFFNFLVAHSQISVNSFLALIILLLTSGPILWIGAFSGLSDILPIRRFVPVVISFLLIFYLLFTLHLFGINSIITTIYPRLNLIIAGSRRLALSGVIVNFVLLATLMHRVEVLQKERILHLKVALWLILAVLAVIIPNNALYGDYNPPNGDQSLLLHAPAALLAASFYTRYATIKDRSNIGSKRTWSSFGVSWVIIAFSLIMPVAAKLWHGSLPEQQIYADHIREVIPENEKVYMYPVNSGYYYLTSRLPSSKYAYISHLVAAEMIMSPTFLEHISTDLMASPYIVIWKQQLKGHGDLVKTLVAKTISQRPLLLDTTEFSIYGPSQ